MSGILSSRCGVGKGRGLSQGAFLSAGPNPWIFYPAGSSASSPLKNSRYLRAALFRRPLRRDIRGKANALPPVSLLDPTKHRSLSFTRELWGGLDNSENRGLRKVIRRRSFGA